MRIRTLMGVVGASLTVGLLGAVARAGEYHVYSCRMPDGESAPVDGWSGSVGAGAAWDIYALDTCGEGGALVVALGDATSHLANVDNAKEVFSPPTWERPTAATLWRAGDTAGGSIVNATYQFWLAGPAQTEIFDECL